MIPCWLVVVESDVSYLFLLICSAWVCPYRFDGTNYWRCIVMKHDMVGKWVVGSVMDDSMLGVLESDFLFIIVFIMNWALYFIFGFS
jgi:hypothetical protein